MGTETKMWRGPWRLSLSLLPGLVALSLLPTSSAASEIAPDAEPTSEAEECRAVFIQLSGPTSVYPGDMVRYRIQVSNEGSCQIKDAIITSFLPRESRFIEALPAPSSAPRTSDEPRLPVAKVEWRGVPLRSSESAEAFDVTVGIKNFPDRVITHTACVEHPKIGRRCDLFDSFIRPIVPRD